MSSLWWCSRTAHCCLLVRGRMSGVRSWSVHDSPCPLGTQRQRQPLPVEIFETTDYPPGPPLGERCPLPKQFPLSLGRPSWGLLLLCLPSVDGGQDGRGSLRTPSSTAPLLMAVADAVREWGWMQGAVLGDEQAGRCNRRTGGGSSCPPRQEVLDRLSLLLCSRELLGHVTGCVTKEASLGYRNPRIPLAAPPRVVREEELAGRFLAVKGAFHAL